MVLFLIGKKIKKIHWCKPEIFFIWLGYVFFGLHKVISTLNIACIPIIGLLVCVLVRSALNIA